MELALALLAVRAMEDPPPLPWPPAVEEGVPVEHGESGGRPAPARGLAVAAAGNDSAMRSCAGGPTAVGAAQGLSPMPTAEI
mmetsp:Transcript_21045/g.55739  ORF Transcript_21045/g.55739 Transcript_21045/m.55739 type:complete len:82 (-) Transcript_21045:191-436(-)